MDENKTDIVLREDPQGIADYGSKAATVLKDIVDKTKSSVMIGGNKYLKFEAWQTIGYFYGSTVIIEWTRPILETDGYTIMGYEARANVINKEGRIVSSAESTCSKDENTWKNRALFQIKSMAQTRACSKALRNLYSWVVVLAGYQATPAEEMEEEKAEHAKNVTPTTAKAPAQSQGLYCAKCKKPISEKVYRYSMENLGTALCMDHQKTFRAEQEQEENELLNEPEEDL